MNLRYRVTLSAEERTTLENLVSGGKGRVRRLKRAQILLAADSGASAEAIALNVAVGTSTVYRTKQRFVEEGLESALSEEPRPGAERKLSGSEEALLVATACSKPPGGRAVWTMELLADEMVRLTQHETLSSETVRRRLAEKELKPWQNSKGAFVAVLYTLRRTANGREGPINKRLIATFESHEALFVWLQREAIKRGYGVKPCLFLADGSEHIWRLQKEYLPLAEACIDWFHVIEKMWDAGQAFHRPGSQALRLWVGRIKKLLRNGGVRTAIRELTAALRITPKTGPGNKGKRKRLADAIRYLTEHRHRMRYDSLRARDLVIGTGVAEGAVRNLVELRLDGPGMRWGRDRSERVLHLRCVLLSGLWDEFSSHVASAPALKLRASPMPARPYAAAPRKEAA
jgi:transposase